MTSLAIKEDTQWHQICTRTNEKYFIKSGYADEFENELQGRLFVKLKNERGVRVIISVRDISKVMPLSKDESRLLSEIMAMDEEMYEKFCKRREDFEKQSSMSFQYKHYVSWIDAMAHEKREAQEIQEILSQKIGQQSLEK